MFLILLVKKEKKWAKSNSGPWASAGEGKRGDLPLLGCTN